MKIFKGILLVSLLPLSFLSCEGDTPSVTNPRLTISDLQVVEGNSNNVISLQVDLTKASDQQVSVSYSSNDVTAKADEDFEKLENEVLSFAPGETRKEISINIIGDEIREEDESFQVILSEAVNADIVIATATVTIYNDDQAIDINIPSSGFTSPLTYPGMTLTWQDEFQGSNISDDWTFEEGDGCDKGICGWGNDELQYYQEENASIASNEYLVIQAKQEDFGDKNYTSARMITQGAQSFLYGRIDIRAALPTGQGMWPALWMLGDNVDQVGWPACGEIDIMEIIGNEPDKCHGTVHWDHGGSYASYGQSIESTTSLSEEFHVYSIIWTESQISWLLDDVQYNVINTSGGELSEFRNQFFFIFNVAVGGKWPGPPDSSTQFPQQMIVDYVRVFQ